MIRAPMLAAALAMASVVPASQGAVRDATEPVTVTLRPAVDRPSTTFEGWGTALAWFANVTGGWPAAERDRLADLFFTDRGLGWTIARYNIGGGNAEGTPPYLRPGGAVSGFWRLPAGTAPADWQPDAPAMWDWSQDATQRWWLDAIRDRVPGAIFEAFSNSPPWFMTVSGRVSGAERGGDDNLRPGEEQRFAAYLARSVEELQRRHHIAFRTLSPVNEPNTDYWFAANRQEGAHWSPARQAAMIDASDAALKARGLTTVVAAPDETNSHLFLTDIAAYPPSTLVRIGQLNVHSYGNIHQTGVRDAARAAGIRLWMSESDAPLHGDPENFDAMPSALAFAEHVVLDLKRLEPVAWVFWQAVEDISARKNAAGKVGAGSNWGLVKADLSAAADVPHPIHITRKYWVMAQFSRYIRPGYRLVPVDDLDTVGALSRDGRTLALVHVNGGITPRRLIVPAGWRAQMVLTDAAHAARCVGGMTAPARSVATLVLTRGGATSVCPLKP